MSNQPFQWEQRPKHESSAFSKGFQGCFGVGCAIVVVIFGLMVIGSMLASGTLT